MKKYFLFVLGIFIFMIMPKTVFALSTSGNATVGRSAVMDTSSNYYYTSWTSLSSNSLNVVPIPYSGGQYYHMGSEYVMAVTLNGETSCSGSVRVPVVSNTIYNYNLMNGLNDNDLKLGFNQNFGVYGNVDLTNWNMAWECQVYPHLGIAHNYCYYDASFNFILDQPLTGSYNFNFAVFNTTGNRSAWYYDGYDSNGNAIEFPVSASNSGYANLAPTVRLNCSSGSGSSSTDTEQIVDSITESTTELQETIQESYENLVKSQEVCSNIINNSFRQGNRYDNTTSNRIFLNQVILVKGGTTYTLTSSLPSGYQYAVNLSSQPFPNNTSLLYDSTWQSSSSFSFTPNVDSYFGIIVRKSNDSNFTVSSFPGADFSMLDCQNGNQALYDGITDSDVNDSTSIASGLLEDAEITDKGLTGLVATILDFINDIFDSTCSPLSMQLPFVDTTLTLPCMSTIYTTYFPELFSLYQLITTGFIAYRIIINLFDKVKKVQDPEYDKVEVLEL